MQETYPHGVGAIARAFVRKAGAGGRPLVVAGDVTVVAGRYPSRTELARFAGVGAPEAGRAEAAAEGSAGGCCAD